MVQYKSFFQNIFRMVLVVEPFNIPAKRVLMMPGLDHQDNYHERTLFCMEMAKKYGFTGLTRLHISAWNQTTGV